VVLLAGDDFVMATDGVRLFLRLQGQGNESLIVPGIGAEMDFGRLCATRRGVLRHSQSGTI
jgi:hypothetical protein